jgi:hypothetical protein
MRYLVRYWDGKNIINDLATDDFSEVIKRERELKKQFTDVWHADAILEILVG